jgi:hypothetical protein
MKKQWRKKNPNSYSEGDLLIIEHAKFIPFKEGLNLVFEYSSLNDKQCLIMADYAKEKLV